MATADEIAELRRATNITEVSEPYTDDYLGGLLDALGFNGAAARLWGDQAAKYASAVDMSESGSSRRLSQLHTNALTMQKRYLELEDGGTASRRGSFTVGVQRV